MSDSTKHWADREERGSYWLMKLTAFAAKVLGRRVLSPVLYAIVLYFFLFGRTARQSAWQYQQRLADWSGRDELRPTHRRVFGQFLAFADSLLDKLDVFGQTINVRASLVEWEARLKVNYLITDLASGERLTRASTVQVAVKVASREMQLASPKVFTDAVERALK